MKIRLKIKLTLAFLLMTLLMVSLISILANAVLDDQFSEYAINKQNQRIENLVTLISSRYTDWGESWDASGLESIGINALNEGLLVRLTDPNGVTLWDARVHNDGMCTMILENIASTMQAQNSTFEGQYVEQTFPVLADGLPIASASIGYYGPYYYTDTDVQFLNTLNTLLLSAAAISVLIAVGLGIILARQLTRPITRVIETTQHIAGGDYAARIEEKSNTLEIAELTTAVNSLAVALSHQENLRKRLSSDVAHELRTPLAILQSHLEAMIDGTWQASPDRLENCHGEVVRIAKMVRDLEGLTLLEQENLVLDKRQLELRPLLMRIVSNFQSDFKNKNVDLRLDLEAETVIADADKLSQVLINLIANALRYTPAGGEVVVGSRIAESRVELYVRDTGIGIAASDLPHIFERFYRADPSRNRQTGGSGIGLTIVKSIVEAHRGQIAVASEPGQGSVFTITLPSD